VSRPGSKSRSSLNAAVDSRPPSTASGGIAWPALVRGTLLKRYQRFLADVRLEDGRIVTAHCANTGRMTGCAAPGRPVYLSHHPDPRRKLEYSWQLIEMPTSLVGVNTQIPNRLVAESITAGRVPELAGYEEVVREASIGNHTRIDLLLKHPRRAQCLVEVKNCTLVVDGAARFPDAVTARGRKHLEQLQEQVGHGLRAVIFYLIQRMDAQVFQPADAIDPDYGRALRQAAAAGVETLAYDVVIDLAAVRLGRRLPVEL
jgi:sugar fermentation stimulation protein A